jgi:hypothetical protein
VHSSLSFAGTQITELYCMTDFGCATFLPVRRANLGIIGK